MKLGELLSAKQIVSVMQASNAFEAIEELMQTLVLSGKIKTEQLEHITGLVKKRECSMSTGIGFEIAIPHANPDCLDEVVAAFGRSAKGIAFDALDGHPVKLVVLILVPLSLREKHLTTLANIARSLHKKEFRDALFNAPDEHALLKLIQRESNPEDQS